MKVAVGLGAGLLTIALAPAAEQQDQRVAREWQPTRDDANGLRLEVWQLPVRDAAGIIPSSPFDLAASVAWGEDRFLRTQDGSVWLATRSHGAIRIDTATDKWRIYSEADGLSSNLIRSVFQDSQSNVWLGSVGSGVGLLRPGDSEIIPVPSKTWRSLWPDIFHEDKAGRIWIGGWTGGGVVAPDRSAILPIEADRGELEFDWVEDVPWGGVILADSRESSAYFVGRGERKAKALGEVLPPSFLAEVRSRRSISAGRPADQDATKLDVKGVFADYSNGTLWLGLNEGLAYCVGGFESCAFYPHWQQDHHGEVLSFQGSSDGWLWVLSSNGFYRLRQQEPEPQRVWDRKGFERYCGFARLAGDETPQFLHCSSGNGERALIELREQANGQAVSPIVTRIFPAFSPSLPEAITAKWGIDVDGDELRVLDSSSDWRTLGRFSGRPPGNIWGSGWQSPRWGQIMPMWDFMGAGLPIFSTGTLTSATAEWNEAPGVSTERVHALWPGKESDDKDVSAVYDDGEDKVWIATAKGLQVCSWQQRSCESSGLGEAIAPITAIEGSSLEGRPYLGGKDGQICRVQGDKCELLPAPEGLDSPKQDGTRIGAVRAVREYGNSLWVAAENAVLHYRQAGDGWQFDAKRSRILPTTEIDTLVDLVLDMQGRIWLPREQQRGKGGGGETLDLSVFWPEDGRLQHLSADMFGGALSLPDEAGAVWVARDEGIGIQRWNQAGVPLRQDLVPFSDRTRWLGRLDLLEEDSSGLGSRFERWLRGLIGIPEDLPASVWRSRWTGMLRSGAGEAQAFPIEETAYPIHVMEPARGDAIWAGFARAGLSHWSKEGKRKKWTQAEGLPDDTILDLSTVPGDNGPQRLWVATNDGAALIENDQVTLKVQPEEAPGPVDALVALPDGGALLAFNPIEPGLFLSSQESLVNSRRSTQLSKVSAEGTVGPPLWLPNHEIRDMALGADGQTIWIGTNAGLYRLTDGQLRKVTAGGRLGDQSIHRVNTASDGTLALGIDRRSEEIPAQILIYDPDQQDVRFLTRDDGLPNTDRIEMLDFAPDGRLVTLAVGRLLRSVEPIVFPLAVPWWKKVLLVAVPLLLGIVATAIFLYRRSRKQLAKRYTEIMTTGERLFEALGQSARRLDYRTLELSRLPFVAQGSPQRPVRVYAVLDTEVGTDQVRDLAKRLKPGAGDAANNQGSAFAYLLFPREMNPAARFELDNYRLREQKTIIPIALPFARRALEKGKDGVSTALDELNRRYLAEQDLFDMRNALDEPRFFFGRRALIDELVEALGRREHIALIGQRKIGKTSLLNVLGQQLDTFPIATADLQSYSREDDWPPKLFAELLASYDNWGRSRFGEQWAPAPLGPGRLSGSEFQQAIRERHTLRNRLGVTEPLVVILDEIERVFPIPRAGGGTLEQVWPYIEAVGALRALGQAAAQRYLCLLVADRSRTFVRVNHFDYPAIEDTNPFYDLFVEKYIRPLSEAECQEMLQDIGHAMGLKVTDGFAAEVYQESGGYPRLARLLASAAYRNRQGSDRLDHQTYARGRAWLDEEDGSADNFVKENIWEHVSAPERVLLADCADDAGVELEEVDQARPVAASDEEASTAALSPLTRRETRHYLLATGLLERIDGHRNRIRVRGALVRRWLRANS